MICASLHFVPPTNVIAIGYAFVLVMVVGRMKSVLKSGNRSPEPDGTDTQAGLETLYVRRCCLACELSARISQSSNEQRLNWRSCVQ